MKLSLLKPILAAAGTALMLIFTLALKPSQALAESQLVIADVSSTGNQISMNNLSDHTLIINRNQNKPTVYILDKQVYTWDALTTQQQQRIAQIERHMHKIEHTLEARKKKLSPLLEQLNKEAEPWEAMTQAMERKLYELEPQEQNYTSLPELEQHQQRYQAVIQDYQSKLKLHETRTRKQQAAIRSIESEFNQLEVHSSKKLKQYAGQIIDVLING